MTDDTDTATKTARLVDLIQIATGLALLLGLVLVFIELRQAKSLSLAELTSQAYSEAMADFRTVMGEDAAATIAKSCTNPDDLAPAEIVVLHAYYNSKIAQISRLRVLELVGDFGVPWKTIAPQQINEVVETEPGQRWFERHVQVDAELYAIGMGIVEAGVDCTSSIDTVTIIDDD
ncbi:MAG: hypothetical protein AAF515_06180 [Pseudomonadota bacterium]